MLFISVSQFHGGSPADPGISMPSLLEGPAPIAPRADLPLALFDRLGRSSIGHLVRMPSPLYARGSRCKRRANEPAVSTRYATSGLLAKPQLDGPGRHHPALPDTGRLRLRIRCPKGRGGSTPPSRTCTEQGLQDPEGPGRPSLVCALLTIFYHTTGSEFPGGCRHHARHVGELVRPRGRPRDGDECSFNGAGCITGRAKEERRR